MYDLLLSSNILIKALILLDLPDPAYPFNNTNWLLLTYSKVFNWSSVNLKLSTLEYFETSIFHDWLDFNALWI